MSKTLVVVESPAKARTIGRFLGGDVQVQASMGHVRDLPGGRLAVDVEHDFRPEYELTDNGRKVIKGLRQAASGADCVYLATDPDREGEAIAWHLQELLKGVCRGPFHRITFHEITQGAIARSFEQPGEIKEDLVAAQQARRVLDRIVGYQVSPLLWHHVRKGTSAGRVQSVALRLVVEREREIQAFRPEEYWNLDAVFGLDGSARLKMRLSRLNGEKAAVRSEAEATALAAALEAPGVSHRIVGVTGTPRRQSAPPPFITSTLQQACGTALHLGASQTMRIAQELYEGIDIGGGGPVGLITYMRTDSVNIAREAQEAARGYIAATYGKEYVPEKPNVYRSRKTAQEAHEAIRPTDVTRTPDSLSPYLSAQQLKVYRIVWNRFVASQMAPARQIDHVIELESSGGALAALVFPPVGEEEARSMVAPPPPGVACTFRASARETLFQGYLRVYSLRDLGDEEAQDELAGTLPKVSVGMMCRLLELLPEQCFTNPPSRYNEASLVKALEANGVGRPSTFATTVNTIQDRDYVAKEKGKGSLHPTELGFQVNDFLVQQLPEVFNIAFTSQMEEELDDVEEGKRNWVEMLREFYTKFRGWQREHDTGGTKLSEEAARALLGAFPEGFEFDPPVQRGMRSIDDGKFLRSVSNQLEKGKELSERQMTALLRLAANYCGRVPGLEAVIGEYGLGEAVSEYRRQLEEEASRPPVEIPPALLELFGRMSSLEWEAPVKRGTRVYDDGKFVRSLQRQVEGGKPLSDSQMSALLKIAGKYAAKIEGYAELMARLAPGDPASASSGEERTAVAVAAPSEATVAGIRGLLAMVDEIREWRAASTRGRRTFDDHEFAQSVARQFELKGSLSDRQIAALRKMLAKYAAQIENFEERSKALGIGEEAQPRQLDEVCPDCGAPLVERMGRGRPFIGCSAFPKCRYLKPRDKEA